MTLRGQRDFHRLLTRRVEPDGDDRVEPALRGAIPFSVESDEHGTLGVGNLLGESRSLIGVRNRDPIVVGNRYRGRRRGAGAYARGQAAAKAELDALPVVIIGVINRHERERLPSVAADERHIGRDAGVVGIRGPVLIRPRQRDHHFPLRIGAQFHRHHDLVFRHVRGRGVVVLVHRVG